MVFPLSLPNPLCSFKKSFFFLLAQVFFFLCFERKKKKCWLSPSSPLSPFTRSLTACFFSSFLWLRFLFANLMVVKWEQLLALPPLRSVSCYFISKQDKVMVKAGRSNKKVEITYYLPLLCFLNLPLSFPNIVQIPSVIPKILKILWGSFRFGQGHSRE